MVVVVLLLLSRSGARWRILGRMELKPPKSKRNKWIRRGEAKYKKNQESQREAHTVEEGV